MEMIHKVNLLSSLLESTGCSPTTEWDAPFEIPSTSVCLTLMEDGTCFIFNEDGTVIENDINCSDGPKDHNANAAMLEIAWNFIGAQEYCGLEPIEVQSEMLQWYLGDLELNN